MKKATLSSQLGSMPCKVADTDEITALRETGDYSQLGDALISQFRYREAVIAYEKAIYNAPDDLELWRRYAGANLTLHNFRTAEAAYRRCIMMGGKTSNIAYYLGFSNYLQRRYTDAIVHFGACYPCENEDQEIDVIFWHTLTACRIGVKKKLLERYRDDMKIGMNTAQYKLVALFCEKTTAEDVETWIQEQENELVIVTALYGLSVWYESAGQLDKREQVIQKLLGYDNCWPSMAYLAAWNDDAFAANT